jgi:hypothetical protein
MKKRLTALILAAVLMTGIIPVALAVATPRIRPPRRLPRWTLWWGTRTEI